MIRLYHTSNIEVPTPDVHHSREHLDFGRGFYLTTLREQAVKYGQRFLRKGEEAFLNVYELDEDLTNFSRIVFDAYDSKWLDYITACRKGLPHPQYDIIRVVLLTTKFLTPSTSIFQVSIPLSKHLTNCASSVPTIKYASLTR